MPLSVRLRSSSISDEHTLKDRLMREIRSEVFHQAATGHPRLRFLNKDEGRETGKDIFSGVLRTDDE